MIPPRQLPFPGSAEARNLGCSCPDPTPGEHRIGEPVALDDNCPVHGRAATARDRAAESGPIDTEGDVVDAANDPELRRS